MKIIEGLKAILTSFLMLSIVSCHSVEEWDNDPVGNFDALWKIVDEHYCFFKEKNIDWDSVYSVYRPHISNDMSAKALFSVCAEMLDVLKDGHTNLSSGFNTSYYSKWWSDYPQNYNERLVNQYYFNFKEKHLGNVTYGLLDSNIGYIRYPSFNTSLGEGNWDAVLGELVLANGLIIDIRDNGGGGMDNVETLASRFVREKMLVGYISHKTGPGHDDFSDPFAYYYSPTGEGHILWRKPVVVLTNRSTFSAANNFVSIMKFLPDTYIVGAKTGGGSGMPFSSQIPCGWGIRFSACSVLDCKGNTTEFGIDPTDGCEVDLDEMLALQGRDSMLDFAVRLLSN